jgi:UDPglucose 6-dehydrogenase
MFKVAIIGHGFVGKAVEYAFQKPNNKITLIDPIYGTSVKDLKHRHHDIYFVCVPTPMGLNGKIDSSIIEEVMDTLDGISKLSLVVIKSTITPDLAEKFCNIGTMKVVYNPEFLRENSAKQDFVHPSLHILGSIFTNYCEELMTVYENHTIIDEIDNIYYVSPKEASIIKYSINSYLSTKVTFFNQIYDLCNEENVDYHTVQQAITSDSRIGKSHTKVPGYDGKQGYGGACFPKDTKALVTYSEKMSLVQSVIDINNTYRNMYELDDREKEQNVQFK